tara:strand:+ start:519 stop:722 length:204 start_codon:yes stop_codon:yes gene_type:complete
MNRQFGGARFAENKVIYLNNFVPNRGKTKFLWQCPKKADESKRKQAIVARRLPEVFCRLLGMWPGDR